MNSREPQLVATALVGTLLITSLCAIAQAPDADPNVKHSDVYRAELERRGALINAEIQSGNVPAWAGEYWYGDGMGVNVTVALAPQAGFTFTWLGCLGQYDANYGGAKLENGRLMLDFELPNVETPFQGLASSFVPVQWGKRHYLISDRDMKNFVNAVNDGTEPCGKYGCGSFLLRVGDAKKKAVGRPGLPDQYQGLLLEEPIYGEVVRVLESTSKRDQFNTTLRITKVEINVGMKHGVWKGMQFHSNTDEFGADDFTVEQVNDDNAIAELLEIAPVHPVPQNGLCLSTRFLDNKCRREPRRHAAL